MAATEETERNRFAEDYLRLLNALAAELANGMQAIARNAVSEFEESVSSQLDLSSRLAGLNAPVCSGDSIAAPTDSSQLDSDLQQQIGAAYNKLRNLNRSYAALINESSHSMAVMLSLCKSFRGQIQEDSGGRSKQQTWSCRI